jgi:hypothetical protein
MSSDFLALSLPCAVVWDSLSCCLALSLEHILSCNNGVDGDTVLLTVRSDITLICTFLYC